MFLETERLFLRKFREDDFEDFCEYAMDEDMCRMMGRDPMPDTNAARLNFNWLKDKEERGYVLVFKETGKVIGNLTVGPVPSNLADRPELAGKHGLSLSFSISRHYQRRGLMQEALNAVIDTLFLTEGTDYIHCGHFHFNVPSRELQKSWGSPFSTRSAWISRARIFCAWKMSFGRTIGGRKSVQPPTKVLIFPDFTDIIAWNLEMYPSG